MLAALDCVSEDAADIREPVPQQFIGSVQAPVDGSQVPEAILAEDAAALSADVQAVAIFTGEINELAVTLGVGHTLASIRDGLRNKSIFLTKNQGA